MSDVTGAQTPVRVRPLLLANAGFRRLWGAHLVSMFGDGLYSLALPWLVYRHTGSGVATAITLAAASVPIVVLGPIAGVYVDRWDRRRTLIGADLLRAVTLALLPLVLLGSFNLFAIIAIAMLLPTFGRFFIPAQRSTTPDLVAGDSLVAANALMEGAGHAAFIAGPAIGGLLMAVFGPVPLFFFDGATFIVSALLIAWIRFPARPRRPAAEHNVRAELKEGLHITWRTPALRTLALLAAFVVCLFATVPTLSPLWVGHDRPHGARVLGIVMSAFFSGALLASLLIARYGRRWHRGAMVAGGVLTMAAAMAAFGLVHGVVAGVAALAVFGCALNFYNVGVLTLLQRLSPETARGRVLSVNDTFAASLRPLAVVIAGAAADLAGVHQTLLAVSVAMLVCGLLAVASQSLHIRRLSPIAMEGAI